MKNLILPCFLLLFCFKNFGQDSYLLNIYLKDEYKESIISAYVLIDNERSYETNEFGFLSTKLNEGMHEIQFQHISYEKSKITLELKRDTTIYINLRANELESIEINSKSKTKINYLEEISLASFKKIPSVTGQPDIIANLTLLPGVSNAKEGNSGFSVRGGEIYQNSILVDRSLLLNPNHLFGLLSTINANVVNDVRVYKNHIPARFGNSSASVIDINVKDGNKDSIKVDLDLGLTNSGVVINGPINSKTTFLFGARSAYLGILSSPFYIRYKRSLQDEYANYNFYDFNFKLRHEFSKSNRITLHVYRSRDNVLALSNFANTENEFSYSWQSNAINLSQYKQFDNGLFWNNYLSYSDYSTNLFNSIKSTSSGQEELMSSSRRSDFYNYTFQSQLSKSINQDHLIRIGTQIEQMIFSPIVLSFVENDNSTSFNPLKFTLNTLSLYIDNDYNFNVKLKLNYGLRYVSYFSQNLFFNSLEPRISLKYEINDKQFLLASFNSFSQNRIQFPLLNFGLPVEVIIPLYDQVKPPLVNQFNLSYVNNRIFSENVKLVASLYYKNLRQLSTIERVLPFVNNFDENFQEYLAFDGIGKAYGLELSLNYQSKKHDVSVNYHLSKSLRKYDSINGSEWFPHEFDRLHELNIIYSSTINSYWSYYFNFALFSGSPITLPSGIIPLNEDQFFYIFEKRNNYRLSPFHRLNLSFVRKNLSHKNGRKYELTFSLYNAYFSRNPYDANLIHSGSNNSFSVNELSVFPIIPAISYHTKF